MEAMDHSKSRQKSLTFRTSAVWTEGTSGVLTSEGKPPIKVSNPPEFKGKDGVWTPEDMFVASVEVCHMATFLAFARTRNLPVLSYESHSNGVLEYTDGDYRFTRIVIFPTINVADSSKESEVHLILREAQEHCLVANSIASIVEVNPTIVIR
jgi:organic hydroperoxide reductase OsmC/OhrA